MSLKTQTQPYATISKEFDFDAAHRLPNVPEGHKCGRMHGHTYRVQLQFGAYFDPAVGWFMDYADIASAWDPIGKTLDHHTLNDIPGLENPTTEVLVHWILREFARNNMGKPIWSMLRLVRVFESSTTFCEAAPYNMAGVA